MAFKLEMEPSYLLVSLKALAQGEMAVSQGKVFHGHGPGSHSSGFELIVPGKHLRILL